LETETFAEPTKPFSELGLSPKVMAAIEAAGYTIATPIQSQAIPVALQGRDVLGIAQTGTGKTAAFVLPMITRLETGRARARMPRSLILAPTRELAAQVEQSFDKYGINHKLTVALLIGGTSMDEQVKKLDRGVDVLIATPGRMLDLYNRGRLMLMGVEILVIDEADRMLDMGFIPDIEKICTLLPPKKQTLFFSATMPVEITRLVNTFLNDPVRIEVARPATTAKTISQLFRFCPDGEDYAKREVLRDLIQSEGDKVKNAIIFCNRKKDVAILLKSLSKHTMLVRCTATWTRRPAWKRSMRFAPARSPFWPPAMWRPAVSTSRKSATSSTLTCRGLATIMSTASVVRDAQVGQAHR
jgi:superfamily II DNA/RNA helicase